MNSLNPSSENNVWKHKNFFRSGLWRAKVLDNIDTQSRGRLQVRILHLHPEPLPASGALSSPVGGTTRPDAAAGPGANRTSQQGIPDNLCPWAEPALPFGGNTGEDAGFFMLPAIGSTVWVAFEMGISSNPVWLGSWLGLNEVPTEVTNPNFVRIIKTPAGHKLLFSDDPVYPGIQLRSTTGHELFMDEIAGQQGVQIKSAAGHEVKIDDVTSTLTAHLSSAPNTKMELTPLAATLSIGTNSIVVTATGVTITINGYTISLNNAGDTVITANGVMTINSNGIISLGTGAVKGVAVDSLLTVLNSFIAVFNAHTHAYLPGPGPGTIPTAAPTIPGVPGVAGVDTSTTVLARAP